MNQNMDFNIRLRVDPSNPGQFFACCGLLELADRLWDGAEGWFKDGEFFVNTSGTIYTLLEALIKELPIEVTRFDDGINVKPLIAPLKLKINDEPARHIIIDSWMMVKREKGGPVAVANPPWNFWSGQQTPLRIWKSLRAALSKQLNELEIPVDLFLHQIPLSGRFGFDPGAAWNALDAGFSPNEQNIEVASSPSVELLAVLGIQRFRPKLSNDRSSIFYSTWGQPMPPQVAAAASSGLITIAPAVQYRTHVIDRGNYTALSYSKTLRGGIL